MSATRILDLLKPRPSSIISTLVFLSQFNMANAEDNENSNGILYLPIGLMWIILFAVACSTNRNPEEEAQALIRNQQPAIEMTPTLHQEIHPVNSYTTPTEVFVTIPEKTVVEIEEEEKINQANTPATFSR